MALFLSSSSAVCRCSVLPGYCIAYISAKQRAARDILRIVMMLRLLLLLAAAAVLVVAVAYLDSIVVEV